MNLGDAMRTLPVRIATLAVAVASLMASLTASLIIASPAFAADDLSSAVRAAFASDPLYAAAAAQARGGDARRRQADALWRPQASLSVGGGIGGARSTMGGASFSAPGFPDTTGASFRAGVDVGPYMRWVLQASQPIYGAERSANARQLAAQAALADIRLELAAQDLRLRVVQTWFDMLAAEDALALLDRQRAAVVRALEEAQERYDAGDAPVTELREAQARRDGLQAEWLAGQAQLRLQRAALEDLTGRPMAEPNRPGAPAFAAAAAAGPSLDDWSRRAVDASPMRRLFDLAEQMATDELAKLRGWTSPTVDLVARASDERLRGDGPWGDGRITASSQAIGVQVNVPLYTGGMRDAQRDEAASALERVRLENADGRRTIRRQVRAAWEGLTTGIARIDALRRSLASARTRLHATELGREAGARTTLDVLNAQAELFAAERALQQAQYALLVDRARLAAAAGELDDAAIERIGGR